MTHINGRGIPQEQPMVHERAMKIPEVENTTYIFWELQVDSGTESEIRVKWPAKEGWLRCPQVHILYLSSS